MHITRRALPLAACLAVAVPATASAATLPVTVTVTGKQQSNYNQPKAYGYKDCFNHYWGEHHAHRKFEFSASARGHLHTLPGSLAFLVWRGDHRGGASFLDPDASITHSYDGLSGADPGDCGGGRPTVVHRGRKCGSRTLPFDLDVVIERDKMRIQAVRARADNDDLDCGISWGSCLDGGDPWANLSKKFSLKRLRGRKPKTLEVTASDRCGVSHNVGGTAWTTGGSQSWTVKITPEGRWKRF